jgi:hypothetical protein
MADNLHYFKDVGMTCKQNATMGFVGNIDMYLKLFEIHISVRPSDHQVILVLTRQDAVLIALTPKGTTERNYMKRCHLLRVCRWLVHCKRVVPRNITKWATDQWRN